MSYKIDLHVHSNISDGSCTPKELVQLAAYENVKAISLTDHDSIEGINEALAIAKMSNIDFLNGIEISSLYKAGGISLLAHYNKEIGLKGFTKEEMEEEIKYLISLGLDGVERYYPSFEEQDYKFLDYMVEKYNLIISGGTDFHGKNRPEINIGSGYSNNLFIPYSVYENIIERVK